MAVQDVDENYNGCWCQKSNGEQVAPHNSEFSMYQTCRTKPLPGAEPPVNETAINEHECLEPWVKTNGFGNGERSIGPVNNRSDCIAKVRTDCPGFDLANMAVDESGTGCWCQKSEGNIVTTRENTAAAYQTCRVTALPGAAGA